MSNIFALLLYLDLLFAIGREMWTFQFQIQRAQLSILDLYNAITVRLNSRSNSYGNKPINQYSKCTYHKQYAPLR